MPKQLATLRDFSGGLNSQRDKRDIADNESTLCIDVIGDQLGVLRTMGNGSGSPRQKDHSSSTQSFNAISSTDMANCGGYGLRHFEFDFNEAGTNTGEHYFGLIDEAGQFSVVDYTNNTWANIIDLNGSATTVQGFITPLENSVRLADASLHASSAVKFYGYINHKVLGLQQASFASGGNTLAKPTGGNNVSSATYTDGVFNINISQNGAGTGSWVAGYYVFGETFIYDGNQESRVYTMSTTENVTNEDCSLNIIVYADSSDGLSSSLGQDYDARITGGRIYWKLYDNTNSRVSDGEWNLLVDIDLTGASGDDMAYGIRSKMSGAFTDWTISGGSSPTALSTVTALDPSIDTYATINGYSSFDGPLIIGNAGDGYKSAIFTNRRMFVANVVMTNASGQQTKNADRIMYSPVNKPDIFPSSNFIDVVKGDAEEYIKLEALGGKLFAYKKDTLFIVNISSPNPSGWFLESTHKSMGVLHPAAVTKTQFGLMWLNPNGLYVYESGSGITELTEQKFLSGYRTDAYSTKAWAKFVTANTIVGYYPKEAQAIIVRDCTDATASAGIGGNGSDVIVYDFKTRSFWLGEERLQSGAIVTNFEYDANGDLIYGSEASDTVTLRTWQSDDQDSSKIVYQTKDFDFGNPGLVKKVYAFYVTYKSSSGTTINNVLSFAVDGGTSFITTNLSNNTFDQATGFEVAKITLSSPKECQSMALKFTVDSATKIELNDVTIEYRTLKRRVAST